MKKLPLKEYKKRCAELWDWLADNPTKTKTDWSEWNVQGGKYPYVLGLCFACEFAKTEEDCPGRDCNNCFLLGLWLNGKVTKYITKKITHSGYTPCEYARYSPYKLWVKYKNNGNYEKTSFYARKIADYCKKH